MDRSVAEINRINVQQKYIDAQLSAAYPINQATDATQHKEGSASQAPKQTTLSLVEGQLSNLYVELETTLRRVEDYADQLFGPVGLIKQEEKFNGPSIIMPAGMLAALVMRSSTLLSLANRINIELDRFNDRL
jgi:hypothetical protein